MFKIVVLTMLGVIWIMPATAQIVRRPMPDEMALEQPALADKKVTEVQSPRLPELPLEKKYFPEMRYPQMDWVKKLHLNDMQVQQWQKIRTESAPKRKELMQRIQHLHRELADLQKADEEKLKLLLNENQLNKYNRQQERLEKMRKRNMPREPKKSLSKKMKTFP